MVLKYLIINQMIKYILALSKVNILSGGIEYDVINPPIIEVSKTVGAGASVQPCVKGKVVDALIDPLPLILTELYQLVLLVVMVQVQF